MSGVKRVKIRVDTGCVCEPYVYEVPAGLERKGRPRFRNEAERVEHHRKVAWRDHMRKVNENLCGYELYTVLTFDETHEVHTFEEARRVRDNYRRRLVRSCPDALIHIWCRQTSAHRWYFQLLSKGVPQEVIRAKWGRGLVRTQRTPGEPDRAAPRGLSCGG